MSTTPEKVNPAAKALVISGFVRGAGAFVFAIIAAGMTLFTLGQSETMFGRTLSTPIVVVTGLALVISSLLTMGLALSGALLVRRRSAQGDLFFVTKPHLAMPRAIFGEPLAAAALALFVFLGSGSLLDASSTRGGIGSLIIGGGCMAFALLLTTWRPFAILSPSLGECVLSKFGTPLIGTKIPGQTIQALRVGLGGYLYCISNGQELRLGELSRQASEEERQSYATWVAQTCGLQLSK